MIAYGECDYDLYQCVCMEGYVEDGRGGCKVKPQPPPKMWGY